MRNDRVSCFPNWARADHPARAMNRLSSPYSLVGSEEGVDAVEVDECITQVALALAVMRQVDDGVFV